MKIIDSIKSELNKVSGMEKTDDSDNADINSAGEEVNIE